MSTAARSELRPPTQRRRDEFLPEEIKNHQSLYFTNDDIVLLSLLEDNIVTAFKVNKIYLLRSSLVFESMLAMLSPDDVEKCDDASLVRMQDEARHLSSFLSALYDPRPAFHQVSGGQLARERIVDLLSADWPSELVAWDINENELDGFEKMARKGIEERDYPLDEDLPEPCSAIRLARDCGVPGMLPAAFYHLSRIPAFADRDDGGNDEYGDYVWDHRRTARFGLLSQQDLECLVKGTHAITKFTSDIFQTARSDALARCKSKKRGDALKEFTSTSRHTNLISCVAATHSP